MAKSLLHTYSMSFERIDCRLTRQFGTLATALFVAVISYFFCAMASAQMNYPSYGPSPYYGREFQPAVMRRAGYEQAVSDRLSEQEMHRAIAIVNGGYGYGTPAPRYFGSQVPVNYSPTLGPYVPAYNANSWSSPPAACEHDPRDYRESLDRYNYRRSDGKLDKYVKKNLYGDPTVFHRQEPLRNVLRFLFP